MAHRPTSAGSVRSDGGFTMVEVLVAATLLLVGMFATLAMLDTGSQATAIGKQRDVANALAQELVERAQGGRYTATRNDMTDVDPAAALPGPADRMRAGLDPDGVFASSAVTPATATSGTIPTATPQAWTVRRRNTTYTVSYRACTASDTYQQVTIAGPFDCSRAATDPTGGDQTTAGSCSIGVIPASQVDPADPGTLTVRLQVLGIAGLNVCVGALSASLSTAVCTLLGSSPLLNGLTSSLMGTNGLLTNLLGGLLSTGATAGLCPVAQVEQALSGAVAGIGTSTRLAVGVSWTDRSGRTQTATQAAVVRKAS